MNIILLSLALALPVNSQKNLCASPGVTHQVASTLRKKLHINLTLSSISAATDYFGVVGCRASTDREAPYDKVIYYVDSRSKKVSLISFYNKP